MLVKPLSLCLAFTVGALLAPTPTSQAQEPRFQFTLDDNRVLRVDTQTGAVSLCEPAGDGYVCRLAAEERDGLMREIDRLSQPTGAESQPTQKDASEKTTLQSSSLKMVSQALNSLDPIMVQIANMAGEIRAEITALIR